MSRYNVNCRFVIASALLIVSLAAGSSARAEEEPPRSRDFERVQALLKTDSKDALRRAAPSIDLWAVVHEATARDPASVDVLLSRLDAPELDPLRAYAGERKRQPPTWSRLQLLHDLTGEFATPESQAAMRARLKSALQSADAFERARFTCCMANLGPWNKETRQLYEISIEVAKSLGSLSEAARSLQRLALHAIHAGEGDVARAAWNRQLAIEKQRGSIGAPHDARFNLATLDGFVGRYASAIEQLRAILSELPDHARAYRSDALQNLSLVHALRGENRSALAATREALSLLDEASDPAPRALALISTGNAELEIGLFETAIERLLQARRLLAPKEGNNARLAAARALASVARAELLVGDVDDSLASIREAMNEFRKLGATAYLLDTKIQEILALQAKGSDEAVVDAGVPLIARLAGEHHAWTRTDLEQIVALSRTRIGDLDAAQTMNEPALERARSLSSTSLIRDGLMCRAEILRARGDHVAATKALDEAYDAQRDVVLGLPEGMSAAARARNAIVLELGIDTALSAKDPAAMFRWIERARGALLESLGDRDKLRRTLVPSGLLQEEETARDAEAKAGLDFREARADGTAGRRAIRALKDMMKSARAKLAEVRDRIALSRAAASDMLYPEVSSLADVQSRLAEDTALVSFVLHAEQASALIVTKAKKRIANLGSRAKIEAAAQALREASLDKATPTVTLVASLRALLVPALGLDPKIRRLTIVPDGVLYATPLSLVFEGRAVTLAPSATTQGVLATAAANAGAGQHILGIGAPNYRGRNLPSLPGTEIEVGTVAKGGTSLLAEAATEERFAMALGTRTRWRAVHLACHGIVDTEKALGSSLELTAGTASDGRLTAQEVFAMNIPCDLAVLSACQTGEGKILRSEGLQGLTRAFMVAGAPRVICSLWKVDDASTRALMIKFYELWHPPGGKPGLSAAEALRQAQAHIRDHTITKGGKTTKPWAHPYYWAAWVLWGLST